MGNVCCNTYWKGARKTGRQDSKGWIIPYLVHGESFGLCLLVKKSKKTSQRPSKRATPLLSLLYNSFQLTHSIGTAAPAENPLVTMPGITFPNLLTERTDELCLFSPLKFTAFVNSFWSYSSTSPSPSYSLGRQSIVQSPIILHVQEKGTTVTLRKISELIHSMKNYIYTHSYTLPLGPLISKTLFHQQSTKKINPILA